MKDHCRLWSETHDSVTMPQWGPYSKRFFGTSKIADPVYGHRFDFFAVPSLYRRIPFVPNALSPSDYLPWDAANDMEYYSYRQQLLWKDQIYLQGSYAALPGNDSARLFRAELCNRTEDHLEFGLHLLSLLAVNPKHKVRLLLPEGCQWLDAEDYSEMVMPDPEYHCGQNPAGYRDGCCMAPLAVRGVVLSRTFGTHAGDFVRWKLKTPVKDAEVFIRFRTTGKLKALVNGNEVVLAGKEFTMLPAGKISGNVLTVTFPEDSEEEIDLELDGVSVGGKAETERIPARQIPEILPGPVRESAVLHFPDSPEYYGLRWDRPASIQRTMAVTSLGDSFRYEYSSVADPGSRLYEIIRGDDAAYDVVLQPIPVPAKSSAEVYVLIAAGRSMEEAGRLLQDPVMTSAAKCRARFRKMEKKVVPLPETPYTFSQERMRAVTMTNIVYPIRLGKEYIRHFTPGRLWDSLYTWDSGFTGMGLLEIDPKRGAESLNTYTYPEEYREAAFVHQGTPLPTQILLFHELMNRTCSRKLLKYFFPRVKKMHDFMSGEAQKSRIAAFSKAGILRTWKYGYNSGGWDDYPAQQYVFRNNAHHILPVINTAFIIRTARILAGWAEILGRKEDAAHYRQQAETLADALQKYSWNEKSRYFSYMVHDKDGNYVGPFLQEDGTDWNMGLDGVSPLIAGAVTEKQQKILWRKLRSPKHFRSRTGLSTVDLSAPYFKSDGYANGANWTSFEFFLWKTALDCGQFDDAWQIASSGMKLWQHETVSYYSCFEHFSIRSGRGNGWQHFSSFSTPYSIWFHAYYIPGRLTVGFDTQILFSSLSATGGEAELVIHGKKEKKTGVLLVLTPGKYEFSWNGKKISAKRREESAWEILLPCMNRGRLKVEAGRQI